MAQASDFQDISPKGGLTGSETSVRSPWCEHTLIGDSDLRSLIEENAFQALSEGSLIKRPRYTTKVSEPDEDNDFLSLTFPRKLWKIVESDQFKSIWWDETGTFIVINEELFKKEVLGRKAPFRIFETDSMKSLIRQLNLYGFSKVRQSFQRSASLADFLAEEKEVSVLSKLQFYQNPNFKRGCPQLLVRMKRRVGIKKASPGSASLVQDFNKKYFRAVVNADDNTSLAAETNRESLLPAFTNIIMPVIRKPTNQRIAIPVRSDVSSPTSITSSEQIVSDQHGILNQLTTFHMHSHSSYTQTNGHVNFVTTTTSTSQYHIISPLQNSHFRLMMEPSNFSARYTNLPTNEGHFSNLQSSGNPWFPISIAEDTSAGSLSSSTHQSASLYQHHCNYN